MKNLPGMHSVDCIISKIALFEGLNIDLDRKDKN